MYNLIKMELYRLCHAKSTWVILIITVAATAALMALTGAILTLGEQVSDDVTGLVTVGDESGEDSVTFGVYLEDEDGWSSEEAELSANISTMLQSGLLQILCVILTVTCVYADQKNGYIKNIAGRYLNRGKMALAKFTAVAVADLVNMIAFVVTTVLMMKAIWGSRVSLESAGELWKVLGVHYLLLLGLSAAVLWFTILVRSSTGGVIFSFVVCCGVSSVIYQLGNLLIEKILLNTDFDIRLYTLENCIGSYGAGADAGMTVKTVALVLIYGTLALGSAAWIMRKRDVV